MMNRITITLSRLFHASSENFSTAKYTNPSKTFLRNDNLMFEDGQHTMMTYFFLPTLNTANKQTYQVNVYSNVLSFVWEAKQKPASRSGDAEGKNKRQDQSKLSFSFRFNELQTLLEVLPKSGATTSIQRDKRSTEVSGQQTLTLIDNPQQKIIHYNYRNKTKDLINGKEAVTAVNFEFSYSQYRVFQILLRKSLFELSGMALIFDLKREQEINSPQNEILKKKQEMEKQVAEFYK